MNIIRMLFTGYNLNVNAPVTFEPEGYTALHVCAMLNFTHAVLVLSRMAGFDVFKKDNQDRSAVDLARRTNSYDALEILLKLMGKAK